MLATLPKTIQALLKFVIDSNAVSKIVLFGSQARKTSSRHSDFDFAVWIKDRGAWTRLLAEIDDKNLTLIPVDFLVYDDASSDYQIRIDQEGILIYGE